MQMNPLINDGTQKQNLQANNYLELSMIWD